jgi:hypothetical protein
LHDKHKKTDWDDALQSASDSGRNANAATGAFAGSAGGHVDAAGLLGPGQTARRQAALSMRKGYRRRLLRWSGADFCINGFVSLALSLIGRHLFHQEILYWLFSWVGAALVISGLCRIFILRD